MSDEQTPNIELPPVETIVEYEVDVAMLELYSSTLQELKPVEKMSGFELAKFIADKALLLEQSVQIINDIVGDFRVNSPQNVDDLYEPFKFIELAGTTMSNHFLAWAYARHYLFARQNARISK